MAKVVEEKRRKVTRKENSDGCKVITKGCRSWRGCRSGEMKERYERKRCDIRIGSKKKNYDSEF